MLERFAAWACRFAVLFALVANLPAHADSFTVPYGGNLGTNIINYNRANMHVATAGLLREDAIDKLFELGFHTIIDLRTRAEGTAIEKAAAEKAGLSYVNIPISGKGPSIEQIAQFAKIVENSDRHAVLVHCVSASRAGVMWALYRAYRGIPPEVAIDEGRTAGLQPNWEAVVRRMLKLPPIDG